MKTLKYVLTFIFLAGALIQQAGTGEKREVVVEIDPVFAGKALAIGTGTYVTAMGDTVRIDRFRFYISGVVLTLEDGGHYPEPDSYHLVDAEDPASFNFTLKNVPAGKISSITFNIGIDSTASVSGALAGPLDPVKGMYWAWNSGYINAKLEGVCQTNKGRKNHLFEFHIGGYMQPYYAIRSVKLNLAATQATTSNIVLRSDISVWLEGLDLKKENSVMIPGKEAIEVADRYSRMFSEKRS